jgi:Tfp pilus assembly protein PilF
VLDPVEAHYAQYKLAEKKGDSALAEQELRRAPAMAPEQPGRIVDLARFLAKRGRYPESEQLFHAGAKASANVARELLNRYLAAELGLEDPSRHEAEKLLREASRS